MGCAQSHQQWGLHYYAGMNHGATRHQGLLYARPCTWLLVSFRVNEVAHDTAQSREREHVISNWVEPVGIGSPSHIFECDQKVRKRKRKNFHHLFFSPQCILAHPHRPWGLRGKSNLERQLNSQNTSQQIWQNCSSWVELEYTNLCTPESIVPNVRHIFYVHTCFLILVLLLFRKRCILLVPKARIWKCIRVAAQIIGN